MKLIKRLKDGWYKQTRIVELEGEELEWPDGRIITACDRGLKCSDEAWQKIVDGAHPGHFGGKVTNMGGNKREVILWID